MITNNPVIPEVVPAVDVTGQTVDIAGQTVDIAGQTVDVSGQTVDVSGQEISAKVKASTAINGSTKTVTTTATKLMEEAPGGQRVLFYATGRIWIGGAGVTAANGYVVEKGDRMEWHTSAALYAITDGDDVEVRLLGELF